MEDKTTKDIFKISEDELIHRMQQKQKFRDEPCQKAVKLLDMALCQVLTRLGVNCELEDTIPQQQMDLGITITEETREEMAGVNGFFVFFQKWDKVKQEMDLVPYGWVGAARINSDGTCAVDIHYFNDEKLVEMKGGRIVQ